jgi:iron complex transport system ATP-binding protein
MNTIVKLKDVSFERSGRAILSDISWNIEKGQHWALLGANGSGKTTLLKIISGYEWPTTGTVEVFGQKYGECNLPELRKHIGLVSSVLECRLPGEDTALEVVLSGLESSIGLYRDFTQTEIDQARVSLDMIGMSDFADHKFGTMSQGEQQRIIIARALISRPSLLILDEPSNGLDPGSQERFLGDLSRLANHRDAPTMLMVTHHIEEIDPWISWVMVLRQGEILANGRKSDVLNTMIMSRTFGMDVLVKREGLRYYLRF